MLGGGFGKPRWEHGRHPDGPESGFEDLAQGDCVSAFLFVPEPPGEEGGESEICKTRKPFQMGRPAAFPPPEGTEPVGI